MITIIFNHLQWPLCIHIYTYICHELWKAGRPCTAATSAIPAIGAGIPPGWASWKCLSKWRQLHIIVHCMYGINSDIIIICLIIYIYIYIVSNDSYILYTYIYIYIFIWYIYIYNHIYIYICIHIMHWYIYIYILHGRSAVSTKSSLSRPGRERIADLGWAMSLDWAHPNGDFAQAVVRWDAPNPVSQEYGGFCSNCDLRILMIYLWYTYDTCEILCTYEWSVEPAQ